MSEPPKRFAYRILARLAPEDRLVPPSEFDEPRKPIFWQEKGLQIEAHPQDVPLKDATKFTITERGFADDKDAAQRGQQIMDALRIACLARGIGLDLGDGRSGVYTLPNGRQFIIELSNFKNETGYHGHTGTLGLQVYEDIPYSEFFSIDGPQIMKQHPLERVLGGVAARLNASRPLTRREKLSCELLHTARFERGAHARFLLTVTAIEALLENAKWTGATNDLMENLVEEMRRKVTEAKIPDDEKNSLKGSLNRMRYESISRTGQALAQQLLKEKYYQTLSPAEFFKRVYNTRSELVHSGAPKIDLAAFESLAAITEEFARDLLLAHINQLKA
jgi:HAMP domain-containing protein